MRIYAHHASPCTACASPIEASAQAEWDLHFGARCIACADARRYPQRRNRRAQDCYRCQLLVPPGLGWVEPEGAAEWRVRCRDQVGCDMRIELLQHARR